jgi:hypothetical protein
MFKRYVKLRTMRVPEYAAVASHLLDMELLKLEQEDHSIRLNSKDRKRRLASEGVDMEHATEEKFNSGVVRTCSVPLLATEVCPPKCRNVKLSCSGRSFRLLWSVCNQEILYISIQSCRS